MADLNKCQTDVVEHPFVSVDDVLITQGDADGVFVGQKLHEQELMLKKGSEKGHVMCCYDHTQVT